MEDKGSLGADLEIIISLLFPRHALRVTINRSCSSRAPFAPLLPGLDFYPAGVLR